MSLNWKRSSDLICHEFDGTLVLVSPLNKKTWVLNESVSFVWKTCDSRSQEVIARDLSLSSGQELSRVKRDLRAFFNQLRQSGMLVRAALAGDSRLPEMSCCFSGPYVPPSIRFQLSGAGFCGRPSSRGVSGPG